MEAEQSQIGRPSDLTPELVEELIGYFEDSVPVSIACAAAGIDRSTFYRWMKRGKAGEEGFRDFYNRARRAKAKGQVHAIQEWRKHFDKDYRSSRDYLSMTAPEHFSRQQTLNVRHGGTVEHQHVHTMNLPDIPDMASYLIHTGELMSRPQLPEPESVEGELVGSEYD